MDGIIVLSVKLKGVELAIKFVPAWLFQRTAAPGGTTKSVRKCVTSVSNPDRNRRHLELTGCITYSNAASISFAKYFLAVRRTGRGVYIGKAIFGIMPATQRKDRRCNNIENRQPRTIC